MAAAIVAHRLRAIEMACSEAGIEGYRMAEGSQIHVDLCVRVHLEWDNVFGHGASEAEVCDGGSE